MNFREGTISPADEFLLSRLKAKASPAGKVSVDIAGLKIKTKKPMPPACEAQENRKFQTLTLMNQKVEKAPTRLIYRNERASLKELDTLSLIERFSKVQNINMVKIWVTPSKKISLSK